ncbi:Nudix hydrolase 3 [Dermatophagoides farinae]|uniref:diphosphoinositol-polyphosphate diphosphatase n=1 Tax=Dermatophagoides farinae TaxID=6954 RepID=A0A922IH26_DERFA|nr:Nudix hydrolase 3 [Dermatophagoides farinae]
MVKEKQVRTYDQDGFRRRAACLCVHDPDESEIMLVTSTRAPEYWIVPGGGVEPNEDPTQAAIRETEEEAGVKGVVKRSLGDIEVFYILEKKINLNFFREKKQLQNTQRKHRTSVFVLEVHEELDDYEDSKSRKRCWFPVQEALKLLAIYKPVQCTYIKLMIQTSSSPKLHLLLSSDQLTATTTATFNGPSSSTTIATIISKNNNLIDSSSSKNYDSQSINHNEQTKFISLSSTTTTTTTTSIQCNDNDDDDDDEHGIMTQNQCDLMTTKTNSLQPRRNLYPST